MSFCYWKWRSNASRKLNLVSCLSYDWITVYVHGDGVANSVFYEMFL